MSQQRTYTVCVTRDVTESVVLRVPASSQEEADEAGLAKAYTVAPDRWGSDGSSPGMDHYVSWSEVAEDDASSC